MPYVPHRHLVPSDGHDIHGSRRLLEQLRNRASALALGGRACQSELQERWAEMHAWCGYLATNLEGACSRIEQLGEDNHAQAREQNESVNTSRHLEYRASQKNVHHLEQRIEALQEEVRGRDAAIAQLHQDLANGKPVSMNQSQTELVEHVIDDTMKSLGLGASAGSTAKTGGRSRQMQRMQTATRVALIAASQAKAESEKTSEELEAEDREAMPDWSLDVWLASLDMQRIVTESILGHVRGAGGEVNSSIELLFMQKLGSAGSRATVMALLRSSSMLDDIADKLWAGIQDLVRDIREDERIAKEEAARLEQEEMDRQALEAERAAMGLGDESDDERMLDEPEEDVLTGPPAWKLEEEANERARELAKQARAEGASAAREAAEKEKLELVDELEKRKQEFEQTRAALEESASKGVSRDEFEVLQEKLAAMQRESEEAQRKFAEADERERLRLKKEKEEEAEAERKANEDRAAEAAKRPKKWEIMRAQQLEKVAKRKEEKKKNKKAPDAKTYHNAIKVGGANVRQLSYGTSEVFFRGLGKVVGRAGADAGDSDALMKLMATEHCEAIDSRATFEPPNFLIPTTSRIEWYAVANPGIGLTILGISDWPKEQRLGAGKSRQLLPPSHFKPEWEAMNHKLSAIGESPLLMHGFVSLRLYTGPMFFKYNNVLRGVDVPGCPAPCRDLFMALCQGNLYANTLHAIAASINKLSRVTKAQTVYRAPGGVLPKSFWDEDSTGVKGGVEMGFMSTSTSYHAAMDYAKRSKIKLIFEISQGMVARGADIGWLSMYPNEAEILFAPLTACEVVRTRIDGSTLVVELRPGAAPASLLEKSIEEKEEDERIEKEKARVEAESRKKAIDEVARSRAKWMNSMGGLKVSVANVKQSKAELAAAQASTQAASMSERAAAAEAEQAALAKNIKAMRQMKEMEAEERAAAEKRRTAQLEASAKLQKAKDMGEYIKKAALRQRLKEEQDALKDQIRQSEQAREVDAQQREALAARLMVSSITATKLKNESEANSGELGTKLTEALEQCAQLTDKLAQSSKRMMMAENKARELQQQLSEVNESFKVADQAEMKGLKDPIDMGEKLETWLTDPKTVSSAANRMAEMCKKDAKVNRAKLMSVGAVEKIVRAMDANPTDPLTQENCCAALGTLTGAPEGKKRAVDAGAIVCVVRAVKTLQRTSLKALFQLTSNDPAAVDAAREAGAKDDWLMSVGGAEEEQPKSPGVDKKKR